MGSEPRQLHVFFFPFMAHGHIIPLVDIARQFAARGAKSTIIATPLTALHLSETVARDQQTGLHITVQIIPFPCVEAGLPQGCENADSLTSPEMFSNFLKASVMIQQPFEKLLENHHPDCLVADSFFPWATDAANKYGIPRLVFHGTSNFSLSVSENIDRYAPHEKVASDSEIFLVPGLPDEIKLTKLQIPTQDDARKEKRRAFREAELKSFGVLANSFYELEPGYAQCYKEMGRRTWNIGPVSLFNRNATDKAQRGQKTCIDEHKCLRWLNSKARNSVLYVSFGSICRFGSAQLQEIAMGLESSNLSFIWVVRMPKDKKKAEVLPEGFEERVEGKGLVITEWAPQVLILDHPAVGGFMTHCGWNSTLEGISAGLPLITWPVFAEQFYNERLITQVLKIGVRAGSDVWNSWIEPEEVSVKRDRIEEVVKQLMGDGEEAEDRRSRARELGEMAKRAVEKEGSSYNDLTDLIEKLKESSQQAR